MSTVIGWIVLLLGCLSAFNLWHDAKRYGHPVMRVGPGPPMPWGVQATILIFAACLILGGLYLINPQASLCRGVMP
jgi:hypothetical protein